MQYHSKILKIVKVTKKNVNRLVFLGHPLRAKNGSGSDISEQKAYQLDPNSTIYFIDMN